MLQKDHMTHLEDVEKLAIKLGFQTRRFEVRELTAIQILEPNGQWVLFDPISQAKDVSKVVFAVYKKTHGPINEVDFRVKLLKEVLRYDFTV